MVKISKFNTIMEFQNASTIRLYHNIITIINTKSQYHRILLLEKIPQDHVIREIH